MAEKIRCMIIDDEEMAIKVIASYIDRIDALTLVASCRNAFDAFNVLNEQQVDLLFLDIQMPQMTGLDFLRTLSHRPKVILTTAYRDYAVEGFELEVLDYLLKPIAFDRFMKTIARLTRSNQSLGEPPQAVVREQDHSNDYIYVKTGKAMEKIPYGDVLFIESFRDNVVFHCEHKQVSTYLKISYLEEKLPRELFLRVHKSFMVSLAKISSYSNSEITIADHTIPIGNYYKRQVLERLENEGRII